MNNNWRREVLCLMASSLRRSLALLLFLVLTAEVQAQFDLTINGDNNTVTITGYSGIDENVVIPSTYNGWPIVSIGDGAFSSTPTMRTITIPSSVTNIGASAFSYCTLLGSVNVPNKTKIGIGAFSYCTGLYDVTFGTNVSIGNNAFFYSGLHNSVTIPSSVTNIGDGAFAGCTSLTGISVSVQNANYTSVNGVLFNKSQTALIQFPAGNANLYTIPNTVTNIRNNAFDNCTNLIFVQIPNSVKSIGNSAFYRSGLTSVTIPEGLTIIASNSFGSCSRLVSALIPSSVTNIELGAFDFCTNLTDVKIPSSDIQIGSSAFSHCTSITNITIPKSVASIGFQAFGSCKNLNGIYFQGNAPIADSSVFSSDNNAIVYFLPGTTGWSATFGGRPTALWNPQVSTQNLSFGVRTNRFGFTITGTSNLLIVVEACADFSSPIWIPVGTNMLNTFVGTNGTSYFSDSQWTNYFGRFYRLRSP